jgi:putative endonuclease
MQMPLPYCVYILFSEKDYLLYVGFTANLKRRLESHHAGLTRMTAERRPLRLIFCEYYPFRTDALCREQYYKSEPGRKAIRYMLSSTLKKLNANKPEFKAEIIYEETMFLEEGQGGL